MNYKLSKSLLTKARWYKERNRSYKAALHYHQVLRREPQNFDAQEELANLYFERGDMDLAAVCFNHLLNEFPTRQDLILRLANCQHMAGNYVTAQKELVRIIRWDKAYQEEVTLLEINCCLALGNQMLAMLKLRRLVDEYPLPIYHLYLADILEREKMYVRALEYCQRGLKREPYFDDLLSLKANIHLKLGEYRKACDIYLKMIRNQMFLEEALMDIHEHMKEVGPVEELIEIKRYFDDDVF